MRFSGGRGPRASPCGSAGRRHAERSNKGDDGDGHLPDLGWSLSKSRVSPNNPIVHHHFSMKVAEAPCQTQPLQNEQTMKISGKAYQHKEACRDLDNLERPLGDEVLQIMVNAKGKASS